VKKFVFLHYGFEKPTPEIMAAWGKWFESMKDNIIDMGGHFRAGREISKAGTKDLPLGLESITGFNDRERRQPPRCRKDGAKQSVVPVGNLRPEILMVQSTQNWHRQRATDGLDGTRDRRVLVQR